MRPLAFALLFSLGLADMAQAQSAMPNYFPLAEGNRWEYREPAYGDTLEITVGAPALIAGNLYYRLSGYTAAPVWARTAEDGTLYYRDEAQARDILLTSFLPSATAWFEAPARTCGQEGQAQEKSAVYEGPAGRFAGALDIRYHILRCADMGIEQELFVPNLGMLSRTVTSFTGPRTLHLVRAAVGSLSIDSGAGAAFRLTTSAYGAPAGYLTARLELRVTGPPLSLTFASGQSYDLELKDASGKVLWKWSLGKAFTQAVRFVTVGGDGLSFAVDVPLALPTGEPLPAGRYILESWLTTGTGRPQFAAAAPIEIPDHSPASASAREVPRTSR